jgi:hypothetical protein
MYESENNGEIMAIIMACTAANVKAIMKSYVAGEN